MVIKIAPHDHLTKQALYMLKAPNWPPNAWRVFPAILKSGPRFVHKMSGKFVPEKP